MRSIQSILVCFTCLALAVVGSGCEVKAPVDGSASGGSQSSGGSNANDSSHSEAGTEQVSGDGGHSNTTDGSGGQLDSASSGDADVTDVTNVTDAGGVQVGDAEMGEQNDAGVAVDGGFVEGMIGTGSCCAEHATPGCSNADLQVCVCELLSTCCTDAWTEPCALIVRQKYCQPGVRECVCGEGDGQWGQTACCDTEWSDVFCDQVAETKCGATPGCV